MENPHPDWSGIDMSQILEVSSIELGGRIAGYNDAHYGMPWVILTQEGVKTWEMVGRPGDVENLDMTGSWCGWEQLLRLKKLKSTRLISKGTTRTDVPFRPQWQVMKPMKNWLPRQKMAGTLIPAKTFHGSATFFSKQQLQDLGPVNCVRLNIFRTAESAASGFLDVPSSEIDASNFTHSAYRSGLC